MTEERNDSNPVEGPAPESKVKEFLSTAKKEILETTLVTFQHLGTCFGFFSAKLQDRKKETSVDDALANLGEQIFASRLGDQKLIGRAEEIDERIASMQAAKSSHRELDIERRGIMIRLGSMDVPASAPDSVLEAVRLLDESKTSAKLHEENKERLKSELSSTGQAQFSRLFAGYSSIVVLLLLFGWISGRVLGVFPGKDASEKLPSIQIVNNPGEEDKMSQAIGFVVCGSEIINGAGEKSEFGTNIGTAFSVTSDGYLLTNKHVIDPYLKEQRRVEVISDELKRRRVSVTPSIWVFFGKEQKYLAEISYVSKDFDLAVLKIDATDLPVFRLSSDANPNRLTSVVACGFPGNAALALSEGELNEILYRNKQRNDFVEEQFKQRDFDFQTNLGTISRVFSESGGTSWIQHEAQIHPGNSGGPLLTEDGAVVGINTRVNNRAAALSFAIKMSQLREELDQQVPGLIWQ